MTRVGSGHEAGKSGDDRQPYLATSWPRPEPDMFGVRVDFKNL